MEALSHLYNSKLSKDTFLENLTIKIPKNDKSELDFENVTLPIKNEKGAPWKIKDFAMQHPILARELAANLVHTYEILTSDASFLSSAKTILRRKTFEDLVTDTVLGTNEHLYTTEVEHSLTPEVIAFLHFTQLAPYIANGIKSGQSAGGNALQKLVSWMPGGNHPFFQGIAGVFGGIAEVKAHKLAADMMTRDQEVLINSIWSGLNGASMTQAVGYGLARKALQEAGNAIRKIHEEGFKAMAIQTVIDIADDVKTNPKTVAISSIAGSTATVPVVAATGLLGGVGAAAALPGVAVVVGGALVGAAGRSLYRWATESEEDAVARTKKETMRRLERWSKKLPIAVAEDLKQRQKTPGEQDATNSVIEEGLRKLGNKVFADAAEQKVSLKDQKLYIVEQLKLKVAEDRQSEIAKKQLQVVRAKGKQIDDNVINDETASIIDKLEDELLKKRF